MLGKNVVFLVGQVCSTYKFGRTQNDGKEYVSFVVNIKSKGDSSATEAMATTHVSVMCFKSNVIKYLRDVGVKYGSNVVIYGFVSSYRKEIKSKTVTLNTVTATDIYAIKSPYEQNKEETENGFEPTDD